MTPAEAQARWAASLPVTVLPPRQPWRTWLRRSAMEAEVVLGDLVRVRSARARSVDVALRDHAGEISSVRSLRLPDDAEPLPSDAPDLVLADPVARAVLAGRARLGPADADDDQVAATAWSGEVHLCMGPVIWLARAAGPGRRRQGHAVLGLLGPLDRSATLAAIAALLPAGSALVLQEGRWDRAGARVARVLDAIPDIERDVETDPATWVRR